MTIQELATWEGRPLILRWHRSAVLPPRDLVTQANGICFTADGRIVLVAGVQDQYGLPGGHPEPGETVEEALLREVAEEACASVQHFRYIRAVEVDDPTSPIGLTRYYQTHFWARVQVAPFLPQCETIQRLLVPPAQFLPTLVWGTSPLARAIFEAAMQAETDARRG